MPKEKEESTLSDWKEIALQFGVNAVREFSRKAIEGVHQKIEQAVTMLIRRLLVLFLLLIGIIFLLVGVAQVINSLLVGSSLGYIVVGAVSVVIAVIVSLANKDVF